MRVIVFEMSNLIGFHAVRLNDRSVSQLLCLRDRALPRHVGDEADDEGRGPRDLRAHDAQGASRLHHLPRHPLHP